MKDQGKISEEEYNTAKAEVDEGLHFELLQFLQQSVLSIPFRIYRIKTGAYF